MSFEIDFFEMTQILDPCQNGVTSYIVVVIIIVVVTVVVCCGGRSGGVRVGSRASVVTDIIHTFARRKVGGEVVVIDIDIVVIDVVLVCSR